MPVLDRDGENYGLPSHVAAWAKDNNVDPEALLRVKVRVERKYRSDDLPSDSDPAILADTPDSYNKLRDRIEESSGKRGWIFLQRKDRG